MTGKILSPLASLSSGTTVPAQPGSVILPIDFIEHWSLCHHLACVVEHVAYAGNPQADFQEDWPGSHQSEQTRLWALKQAEGFLVREITNRRPCVVSTFQNTRDHPVPLRVEAAIQSWGLSENLGTVLFQIVAYQKLLYRLPQTRVICLKEALRHLRREIQSHRQPKIPSRSVSLNLAESRQ